MWKIKNVAFVIELFWASPTQMKTRCMQTVRHNSPYDPNESRSQNWFKTDALRFPWRFTRIRNNWKLQIHFRLRILSKHGIVRKAQTLNSKPSILNPDFFFFFTLVTGPRRSLSLKLSDTRVYEPQIRARLGTTAHCWTLNPQPGASRTVLTRSASVPPLPLTQEGRCKATWKREFKLPWREAGPPNHHDDKVGSDQ